MLKKNEISLIPTSNVETAREKIKLLLFDVDDVLTDGKLFIFPASAGMQQSLLQQSAQHSGEGGFGLHN